MYKLLLVDDEEDVRDEVDWPSFGFEAPYKAENGIEAQELIEKWVPDVVVTDIKMPFMDGLQLSTWIREHYPMIKIIILTGFDEFDYAQQAVKLHVNEYVLKPFSAQELMDVLVKVKCQLDEEIAQKENVQILQEHYRKSLPILRETFLASLISGKLSKTMIREKSLNYNIDLNGSSFICFVISMDSPGDELKQFAILNIAEEMMGRHQQGIVFMHHDYVICLTMDPSAHRDEVMNKTIAILGEIRHNVERYLKITITIGVGSICYDAADVQYSYEGAISALDYRLILGGNRVICIDDVERRFVDKLRFDELKEHALIRSLKIGTIQEIHEMIDQLFDEITVANVSVQDFQLYLLEMLTTVLKVSKDANVDFDAVFGTGFQFIENRSKFTNLQEAKSWFIGICTRIINRITNERQYSYKNLVEQAKQYVHDHFQETDISINKVCSHLHISSGYLSSIFKKETKTTFVSYLLQIRMETAKQLLRTTDLRSFEIAEKVGFSDPNYFSFCFRKHCGISPKDYKNSAREG